MLQTFKKFSPTKIPGFYVFLFCCIFYFIVCFNGFCNKKQTDSSFRYDQVEDAAYGSAGSWFLYSILNILFICNIKTKKSSQDFM